MRWRWTLTPERWRMSEAWSSGGGSGLVVGVFEVNNRNENNIAVTLLRIDEMKTLLEYGSIILLLWSITHLLFTFSPPCDAGHNINISACSWPFFAKKNWGKRQTEGTTETVWVRLTTSREKAVSFFPLHVTRNVCFKIESSSSTATSSTKSGHFTTSRKRLVNRLKAKIGKRQTLSTRAKSCY